jgi:hypothetical protein
MKNIPSSVFLLAVSLLTSYTLPPSSSAQALNARSLQSDSKVFSVYVRAAKPEEVFGVWEVIPVPGVQYPAYEAVMADGHCAYLSISLMPNKEGGTLSSDEVIKRIDSETNKERPSSWHPCTLTEGNMIQAAYAKQLETYYKLFVVTNTPEGAERYSDRDRFSGLRRMLPGDIIIEQYYKVTPSLSQSIPLAPIPIQMRRLKD